MRSNDTLVDTPFQLISGFFHVNQGVLCSEHAEQAFLQGCVGGGGGGGAATGLLNKGGGSNRLPGLVTKQQAVEFPQVLTSITYILIGDACMEVEYYICQYNLFLYFLYR